MKILHLSAEKTWRGGEQQIAYLMEESIKQGVQVHAACQRGSAFETYCSDHGLPFSCISFKALGGIQAALTLKKLCREHDFDLIHAHSSHAHGPAVFAHSLGLTTPIVLSRRIDFPVKNKAFSHWKYNHSGIKKIICVSNAVAEIMRPAIKVPEKLVTVYDGIDPERFQPPASMGIFRQEFNIPEEAPLIGNVAALADHKDHFTFLRTAARIHKLRPDARFLIAGEGELRAPISEEISRLQLEGIVTLVGFRTDIPAFFRDLDIYLMTSKTEGLGSSILDAFANLVPVVVSAAGGITELVQDQKNGLVAPVGDDDSLANHVISLLEATSSGERRTQQAHLDLLEKFSKSVMTKETISHYHDILNNHG